MELWDQLGLNQRMSRIWRLWIALILWPCSLHAIGLPPSRSTSTRSHGPVAPSARFPLASISPRISHHAGPSAQKQTKYIIVTGGVMSGIGKGITASSIGVLLKMMNLRPTAIKLDPYLNMDAGRISPYEHGKCKVRFSP